MSPLLFIRYPATVMVLLAGIYSMRQPAGSRSTMFVLLAMGAIGATELVLGAASVIQRRHEPMELAAHLLTGVGALGISFAQLNETPTAVYITGAVSMIIGVLLAARSFSLKLKRLS